MTTALDHLVIAGTDLTDLLAWWRNVSGSGAQPGGAHPGMGTRNTLAGLGGRSYVELIGPDPEQTDPLGPRPFGIDALLPGAIRLVTFAVAVDDIATACDRLAGVGVEMSDVIDMGRVRPDGVELAWKLSLPTMDEHSGVMPFLIDWGDTPHPSDTLPTAATLDQLRLTHPEAATLGRAFDMIGLDLTIETADSASLRATLRGAGSAFMVE